MQHIIYKANERGLKDIGWLQSNFSFSFSSYANPVRNSFGLLRTFNDDIVKPKGGFGLHAHTNMEIISVMLQGKMNHKDTLGYSEVVEADHVQIMSAGSGLRHEEHNIGDDDVNFLQIWVEPKLQNITPRYQRRSFPRSERKNKIETIVSNEEGVKHCWINQNAKLSLGYVDAGFHQEYHFNTANKCVYIYVMEGGIEVAGNKLQTKDAIGVWDTSTIDITATELSHFIIIEVPINQ
jgi:redox-sensitive bicupin YhaK (pirin superfamily)